MVSHSTDLARVNLLHAAEGHVLHDMLEKHFVAVTVLVTVIIPMIVVRLGFNGVISTLSRLSSENNGRFRFLTTVLYWWLLVCLNCSAPTSEPRQRAQTTAEAAAIAENQRERMGIRSWVLVTNQGLRSRDGENRDKVKLVKYFAGEDNWTGRELWRLVVSKDVSFV